MYFFKARQLLTSVLVQWKIYFTDESLIGRLTTCHTTGSFNIDIAGTLLNIKPHLGCSLEDFISDDEVDITIPPREEFDTWYALHDFLNKSFKVMLPDDVFLYTRGNIMYISHLDDYIQFEIKGF